MRRRASLTLVLALSLALPPLVRAQAPAPAPADKGTPRTTAGGATFSIPAGWTLTTHGDLTVLTPPETDTHVAILDVKAKGSDAAVAAGWMAYQPGFKRPLKIALPQAPRDG